MIAGTVVRGHGVASGVGGDPRFPDGTLRLQFPIFARLGLDLSRFHPGTINLDIAPASYCVVAPAVTLTDIQWHPDCAAETFSFFDCRVAHPGTGEWLEALIYRPHPETKPEHFQSPSVLEILAPQIDGLSYGQRLVIETDPAQLEIA